MKKKIYLIFKIQILIVVLLGSGLISCKNFLQGQDFKDQLKQEIDYANAPYYEIRLECNEGEGSFIGSTVFSKKVTDTFNLEFKISSEYQFEGWKAFSKNSSGSYVELSSDYIAFTNLEADDDIYSAQVNFLKSAGNIIIEPVCVLISKIIEVTPVFESSGCEQDKEIIITFNKAIDVSTFTDFNITFTSDGEDISDKFSAPQFPIDAETKECRAIYIYPLCSIDESQFLVMPNDDSTRNINIDISFTGMETDLDGIPFTGSKSHVYKVNKKLNNTLPSMELKISGRYGKFSPSTGTYTCIKLCTYPLSFDPDTDYEFIKWEVYDTATDLAVDDYEYILNIEDPYESSTNYSLAAVSANPDVSWGIRPLVAERPQIISYLPMTSGVFKDSTIQILFDQDMSESSIYYTESELEEIFGHELSDEEKDQQAPYKELVNGESVYYGYIKNGEVYFKNISIINKITGENLNSHFKHPVFDNASSISVAVDKSVTELDSYTQIMVTADKGLCYKVGEKAVEMAGKKKWLYQVNSSMDNSPLIITTTNNEEDFSISFSDDSEVPQALASFSTSNGSGIENLSFMNNRKLRLKLTVTEKNDTESGPTDSFTIHYEKIYDEGYQKITNPSAFDQLVLYNVPLPSGTAGYDGDVDILPTLEDGIYEISLIFKDKSGNSLEYPQKYYAVKDYTVATIDITSITSSLNSSDYTFNWNKGIDVKETSVKLIKNETLQQSKENLTDTSITLSDIDSIETKYDVLFCLTDHAGNYTEIKAPVFLTGFIVSGTPSFPLADNLLLAGDTLSTYNFSLKKYWSDGTSSEHPESYVIPEKTSNFNSKSTFTISCDENGIKKSTTSSGSYYTARSDALTQTPVTSSGGYKFGDYPQEISKISSYSSDRLYNGWYLGSDGYFYEYCYTNITGLAKSTTGATMSNHAWYYFKVMPIEWKCRSTDFNGKRLLCAARALDGVQYYNSTSTRIINGSAIYPNNYKYSTLRAFLNGKYESGDTNNASYNNNGFLQRAFTPKAQACIATTSVNNSARSCNPNINASQWNGGANVYACENTSDKVFALSIQEATTEAYGFNKDYTWQYYGRLMHTTDYAKAKGAYESKYSDNSSIDNWGCAWLLRSPREANANQAWYVTTNAAIIYGDQVTVSSAVLPALCLE